METKLKLISNQIPWWSVFKGAVAGLSWFVFPFWLFFLIVNYLYWSSLFEAGVMLAPFLIALVLAGIAPSAIWSAIVLGAIFFFIFGIKELAFINRSHAFEMLAILLFLLGSVEISTKLMGTQFFAPIMSLFAGVAFFLIRESTSRYESRGASRDGVARRKRFLGSAIGAILVWELTAIVLILPFEPLNRGAVVFAGSVAAFFLVNLERGHKDSESVWGYVIVPALVMFLAVVTTNWSL